MSQHDYNIANATFPSTRTDINSVLAAINTSNSGTSRPSAAVAGTIWLDTTSATTPTLKFYDGTDDISLATFDYSANTVNWIDSTVVFDIVGDTTPQLGGDLDVNGNSLVSTSDGDITFTPNGTGKVVISGLSFPTADGSANQVLKTDGSGNLSFTAGGGTSWQSVQTSSFTAVAGNGYPCNTTSSTFTVTLPGSASVGDTIALVDYAGTFATNNLRLISSLNIEGSAYKLLTTNREGVTITYADATQGWVATSGVNSGDQAIDSISYSADFLVIAGGASGGASDNAGGGGAGGYRTSTQTLTGGTITITVGDGGATVSPSAVGLSGSDSSISGGGITTITSAGGGGGGTGASPADPDSQGKNGGSGGGNGHQNTSTGGLGNTPSTSPSQGNNGGSGSGAGAGAPPAYAAGGGGGASAAGAAGSSSKGGNGGNGTASSITGSSVTRAGGGGGGTENASIGTGGSGGGGNGAPQGGSPTSGTVNTGSGGGAGDSSGGSDSGTGGKGVVILSVPTTNYSGTTTGSPTVTTSGANTIMQFNGSGSYTA